MKKMNLKQTEVWKKWGIMAAALVLYALGNTGISLGCARTYTFFMEIWGVTSENFSYAPWWIRTIAYGYTAFIALAQMLWVLVILFVVRKTTKKTKVCTGQKRWIPAGWGMGAAFALLCAGILLLTDSVRMGWPLHMPRLLPSMAGLLPAVLLGAAAREWFFRSCVYTRLGQNTCSLWVTAILCAALHGIQTPFSLLFFLNTLLFSALMCLIYEKTGSLGCTVGFRAAFELLSQLLGFEGSTAGIYELYHVSRPWLSGGSQGPMAGCLMTVLLLLSILWFYKNKLQSVLRKR